MNTRIILAILLVTGSIPFIATPMASAKHFSVGAEDTVLVTPSEDENNPSVPPDGDFFQTATTAEESDGDECFRPTGDLDKAQSEATRSLEAEAACGLLVYNEGTTFEQTSPIDQTYHAQTEDLRFDAVYTMTVSTYGGVSDCVPFCPANPGRTLYDAFHDNASQVGLTEDSDDADYDKNGNYVVDTYLLVPHATAVATQESGLYENNGWLFPIYDETVVAFLEERDPTTGEYVSVGPDRLETIVAEEKKNGLDPRATSEVCLYSADQKITTGAADISSCETAFEYISEPEQDADGPVYQGPYSDKCSSPTYSCGAASGPYWQAQVVCSVALSVCIDHDKVDLIGAALFERDGYDTTRDYDVWHYVVAPVQSACNGDQEPGFVTDSALGSPFLAHDLDVYEPAAAPAGGDQAMPIEAWQRAFYDENQPGEFVRNSVLGVPVRTLAQSADPTDTFDDYSKAPRVEPNAAGDTSQMDEVIPRNLEDDPCIKLINEDVFGDKPREVEHTTDPWVNVASNDVTRDQVGDVSGIALYGNDAQHQDDDNRPGPAMFYTSGFVGMFTDRNDDGDYDQAAASEALTEIQRVGAYPMYYDMWVDLDENDNPQVSEDRGCTWSSDKGTLPGVMASAGYGMRTGLIQAVLINEPTVLFNDATSDPFINYTDPGPKIFLFATQAIHQLSGDSLATFSDGGDTVVENQVKALLDTLPVDYKQAQVVAANELNLSTELPSDFGDQCGTSTGSYSNTWRFLHDCNQFDCSGDTIATAYTFELDSATIGEGGQGIPFFQADGTTNYEFGAGQHTWLDVDPFDNDPSRNLVEDAAPCSNFSNLFQGNDFGNRTECPDETTGLQVSSGTGDVSLSWDAVDGADGYIVKRVEGQGEAQTITRTTVTGTSYTDTSVTTGTEYTYSVGAYYAYDDITLPDRPGPFTAPQPVTVS